MLTSHRCCTLICPPSFLQNLPGEKPISLGQHSATNLNSGTNEHHTHEIHHADPIQQLSKKPKAQDHANNSWRNFPWIPIFYFE